MPFSLSLISWLALLLTTQVDQEDANQGAQEITNVLGGSNNSLMQNQDQNQTQNPKILLAVSFKFDNMPCIRVFILAVTLCLLVPTSSMAP
jgi:hypothetical protein